MGMDVFGRDPSAKAGTYFRASVWSWRSIHAVCELVTGKSHPTWAHNDGCGYDNQDACTELAEALEGFLQLWPEGEDIELLITAEEAEGKVTRSPYSVSPEHLREFVGFLRHCGGFQIW